MKYIFLLCSIFIFYQLSAEKKSSSKSSSIVTGEIELTVPPSFYTDSWDPKEELPLKLPGIRFDEKNLIVDLEKAIKESRKKQDLLRSQNNWLSEKNPYFVPIEPKEEFEGKNRN